MSDEKLIGQITAELDASVAQLDGATRSKLTQARYRALSAAQRPRWVWPTISGAVAASLLALMVWHGQPVKEPESLAALDYELLNEGDTFEIYQEMDFLQWLEEAEQNDVV